jgi:arylsulfatase A-like enzyme
LKPEPEQHVDGVSIMPVLQGNESFSRGTLFWHYPHYSDNGGSPGASLRDKAYKLIKFFEDDRIELYDLEKDLREETDIASEMPGKVAELHEKLIEWQKEVGALFPEKNPDYAEQFLAF